MYKKIFFIILLFSLSSLKATLNEPVTFEIGIGYRQDSLNWKSLTDNPIQVITYQEVYKYPKYLILESSLRKVYHDIYFSLIGGGAAIGSGNVDQNFMLLDFSPYPAKFSKKSSGYDGYLEPIIGYQVDITPDRFNKFIITPTFGYLWIYKYLQNKNADPSSIQISNGSSYLVRSDLTKNFFKERWRGFSLGLDFQIEPGGRFSFEAGYKYNWLKLNHSSHSSFSVSTNNFLRNVYITEKTASVDGYAHRGKIKATYLISNNWLSSLKLSYDYYVSNEKDIDKEKTTETFLPNYSIIDSGYLEKFIVRWWFVSAIFSVGYKF